MTREEAKKILEAYIACESKKAHFKCSDDNCDDNCPLLYEMGTVGEHNEAINMAIQVLEQTQWIPVSERLPEEGVDVLACFYTGERNYKMMVSRRSDYNYWNGVGRTSDMVAWMPLPEPWKGE